MYRQGTIVFDEVKADIYEWAASDEVPDAFMQNRMYVRIISLSDERHRIMLSLDRFKALDELENGGPENFDKYIDRVVFNFIRTQWKTREEVPPNIQCPLVVID